MSPDSSCNFKLKISSFRFCLAASYETRGVFSRWPSLSLIKFFNFQFLILFQSTFLILPDHFCKQTDQGSELFGILRDDFRFAERCNLQSAAFRPLKGSCHSLRPLHLPTGVCYS